MSLLWTWSELVAACELQDTQALGVDQSGSDISGVSIDTRTLQAGDLFIALSASRDGHEFIADAEEKGAAAVMVDRKVETRLPQLRVADTLDGLWALGRYARRRMQGKVAAITGSSGKTTARHWLQTVLAGQGRIHGSEESFNNHWGVPLSLARMPAETDLGVFEVGMNHPGEIAPLAELVAPDVALIVNVLPAHLGHFNSLDDIRLEKLSIAAGLAGNGCLVIPDTLDPAPAGRTVTRIVTFGSTDRALVHGEGRDDNCRVIASIDGASCEFDLGTAGLHRVQTGLAVLAAAYALGVDVQQVCQRFADISTPPGRGNILCAGDCEIIDDSYNANPVSMRYALESLAAQSGRRRIAILGEMRELGPEGRRMHLDLAPYCQALDGVITVGGGFADFGDALGTRHWAHYDDATQIDPGKLVEKLVPGDIILVKGANKIFWAHDFVNQLRDRLTGGEQADANEQA